MPHTPEHKAEQERLKREREEQARQEKLTDPSRPQATQRGATGQSELRGELFDPTTGRSETQAERTERTKRTFQFGNERVTEEEFNALRRASGGRRRTGEPELKPLSSRLKELLRVSNLAPEQKARELQTERLRETPSEFGLETPQQELEREQRGKRVITDREIAKGLTQADINLIESGQIAGLGGVTSAQPLFESLTHSIQGKS